MAFITNGFKKNWSKCFMTKMGIYTLEVRKLCMEILEGIMESLGLCSTYMKQDIEQDIHIMAINHYPPDSIIPIKCKDGLSTTYRPWLHHHIYTCPGKTWTSYHGSRWWFLESGAYDWTISLGSTCGRSLGGVEQWSIQQCLPPGNAMLRWNEVVNRQFSLLGYGWVVEPAKELVDEEHPRKYKACANDNVQVELLYPGGDTQWPAASARVLSLCGGVNHLKDSGKAVPYSTTTFNGCLIIYKSIL